MIHGLLVAAGRLTAPKGPTCRDRAVRPSRAAATSLPAPMGPARIMLELAALRAGGRSGSVSTGDCVPPGGRHNFPRINDTISRAFNERIPVTRECTPGIPPGHRREMIRLHLNY